MHFIINFEISFVNFLKVFGFMVLTSEKNGDDTFLICYFLVINIYCFFDDHDTWLRWSWYMDIFYDLFKCLRFLKGCLNAILQFPSHLQENLEIKKHTHTPDCFSLKNHGQSFFWNHLFLPFSSRINRGCYFRE